MSVYRPRRTADGKTIHQIIADECALAQSYADIDSYGAAAAVLRRVAAEVKSHADRWDAESPFPRAAKAVS